ncbi:hypothetical protein DYH56_12600 [Psychrilyobacter piezotolerans]|uniref:Uncharacterized protein n=2 Tax=Fusobacteriaceae TaxID=203492 RepID=A0ABX9KEP1_9FUSO|nr:hypothetical protein DV867_12600 [Psychrilyobacter sp. S5]REI40010.1 hypothetical protein DYH56_12600 [Psychrilyobacter piezotolerans]
MEKYPKIKKRLEVGEKVRYIAYEKIKSKKREFNKIYFGSFPLAVVSLIITVYYSWLFFPIFMTFFMTFLCSHEFAQESIIFTNNSLLTLKKNNKINKILYSEIKKVVYNKTPKNPEFGNLILKGKENKLICSEIYFSKINLSNIIYKIGISKMGTTEKILTSIAYIGLIIWVFLALIAIIDFYVFMRLLFWILGILSMYRYITIKKGSK